jgi:hypothetical protein
VLALAALMLAAAPSATPSPALASAAPWWERFTFTMTDDGAQQGCSYESSTAIPGSNGCGDSSGADPAAGSMHHAASSPGHSAAGPYTKITIERRYSPASAAEPFSLQAGDTLIGGQVLALAIDRTGNVMSCNVVKTSGEMKPPYGCDEARSERFDASAKRPLRPLRYGYMTVLVYGHEEYPV